MRKNILSKKKKEENIVFRIDYNEYIFSLDNLSFCSQHIIDHRFEIQQSIF